MMTGEPPLPPNIVESGLISIPETRLELLRALADRPRTVTELSKLLDLDKAHIFRTTTELAKANLVIRLEDDRLWVYYHLAKMGHEALALAERLSSGDPPGGPGRPGERAESRDPELRD
jgi:DNA-binding transcriptional ArsR family regulator